MREAVKLSIAEARRDLSRNRASQFFTVLLAVMILGCAALAVLGNEFGLMGLLFLAGGLPGAVVVVVAAHATARTRKTVAVAAVVLIPAWIALGIAAIFIGPPLSGMLMASNSPSGYSVVGSAVQGFVMISAIQGGIVLLKGTQDL